VDEGQFEGNLHFLMISCVPKEKIGLKGCGRKRSNAGPLSQASPEVPQGRRDR
jgi:hypothetical protein